MKSLKKAFGKAFRKTGRSVAADVDVDVDVHATGRLSRICGALNYARLEKSAKRRHPCRHWGKWGIPWG